MKDEEIRTKTLSDWKPETDIKLQKAFGKFVEEAGELLEVCDNWHTGIDYTVLDLEDELADNLAVIEMIRESSDGQIDTTLVNASELVPDYATCSHTAEEFIRILCGQIGRALTIVGRCQIQGLNKSDPETGKPNLDVISIKLSLLKNTIHGTIEEFYLNQSRIKTRKQAKIDSKLPWVMGTATDLLPDD